MAKNKNQSATFELKVETDDLKKGINDAKREIAKANSAFKSETAGMEAWSKDADGLSAKLKNLASVLKGQNKILATYNEELSRHEKKHKETGEEIEKVTKKMNALAESGQKNSAEYKNQAKQLADLKKFQAEEADKIEDLNVKIASQTATIDKTKAAYEKWEKAQADLEKESKSLVKVVEDQEKELAQLKKEYSEVVIAQGKDSDSAKELQKRIFDLSGDLKDNKKQLADAAKSADFYDQDITEAGKAAKNAGEEVEDSSSAWQRAKDNIIGWLVVEGVTRAFDKITGAVKNATKALGEYVKNGAAFADDIITLSSQTGIATETLQEFKYMEDLVDVSTGTIAKSMNKLKKTMGDAAKGSKTQKKAFKELGVAYKDTNGELRSAEDVFYDVIEALGSIENETERDAKAMQIFGKSATELNPIIEAGSETLGKLKQEAHDVGYVLDGDTLSALGRTQDAMDRMNKRVEGVKNQFASALAPAVADFAEKLDDTIASPRTQRALDVFSEGIGNFVSGFSDLAISLLPKVVDAFGLLDSRLATYTDAQLIRKKDIDDLAESWGNVKSAYTDNAQAILDNSGYLETLFGRLKDITDETGHVKDADKELADFIVNELNEKLGLNIEYIDGVIKGWKDVQTEIQNTIDMQTAQALLDAGREKYTKALEQQETAMLNAAKASADLEAAQKELDAAEKAHKKSLEEINDKYGDVAEAPLKVRFAYIEEGNAITKLKGKVADLTEDYKIASQTAKDMAAETETYGKAMTAMAEKDYQAVIDYQTKGYSVERDYIKKRGQLKQEEVNEAKRLRDDELEKLAWYHKQMENGEKGFNEEEYKRMQAHYRKLDHAVHEGNKELLEIQKQANEEMAKEAKRGGSSAYNELKNEIIRKKAELRSVGKDVSRGFSQGIEDGKADAKNAAKSIVNAALQAMRLTAQIASPSKVTQEFGKFLDLGLAEGMLDNIGKVKSAAQQMASAAIPSGGITVNGTGAGTVNNNYTQNIYSPKSPSRLEIYRDTRNLLQMAGGI